MTECGDAVLKTRCRVSKTRFSEEHSNEHVRCSVESTFSTNETESEEGGMVFTRPLLGVVNSGADCREEF